MADNTVVFVFFQKLARTGKSDLVEVFLHLIRSHTDAAVADNDTFCITFTNYFDMRIADFAFHFAAAGQCL